MDNTYIEDGFLKFKDLRDDILRIAITYNNDIWGNLNPYYAQSEDEKTQISTKDNKISNLLGVNTNFVLTTPPENTICHLNDAVFNKLLNLNKKDNVENTFASVRANALLTAKRNEKFGIIVAPADCAVVVISNKQRDFVIVIHFGFPQYLENVLSDTITLAKSYFDLNQELDAFVTPYICSQHYLISDKNYQKSLEIKGEGLSKHSKQVFSEIYKEQRWSIDIESIVREELNTLLPNSKIIESGLCTYEEVEKGNLFSHKYATDMKQLEKSYQEGSFNVIVTL